MQEVSVKTHRRNELLDITDQIAKIVNGSKVKQGTVTAFIPHTTAAVTINENADPSVIHDLLLTLEELIPQYRSGYRHSEGNSDAHLKATLVGSSVSIFIDNGRLCLGTWQGIYFCEFDGPRSRRMMVQISPTQ